MSVVIGVIAYLMSRVHPLAGCGLGCCPVIVRGCKGSVIQPFTGWRGNVALIVDYGTCTNQNHGFRLVLLTAELWCNKSYCNCSCCVYWGDGSHDCKYLDDFGPCQLAHQYVKTNAHYRVTALYCSLYPSRASCCRTYTRCIDTSYDPSHISF